MILLLDAGNSRIKWGCWQAGAWRGQGAVAVAEPEALAEVLAGFAPTWAGVSCVAGPALRARIEVLLAGLPVHWLTAPGEGHGIINRYARPESLGADRYAGLVACQRGGLSPCVLASAGTALTVDALTGEGEFLGGMILPGAALMRHALATGTAAVADTAGGWQPFPRATGDAVETGVLTALTGAVEAMRGRLLGRLGGVVPVVLTGGDGGRLAADLADPVRVENNLVLEGLLWIARDLGVAGV
jgi:type III pantothenate kinase